MDALNFFKFWRNPTTNTTTVPHLVVETDTESDEDDSFFDLELTLHGFDNKENNSICNKTEHDPQVKTETKIKTAPKSANDTEQVVVDVTPKTTKVPLSHNEPISKRKVLPIEPISKPQSPIALLRSAPSFRIFTFRKHKPMAQQKSQSKETKTGCERNQKKETKVFAVKLNIDDFHCSPALSRDNSTRSFGSKVRSQVWEEPKPERVSEGLQKYLKLIKPLYVKVSKRYSDRVRFSGEGCAASPSSSPSVASVSSKKEKQGNFPAGMRVVSKHLGKGRLSCPVAGVGSLVKRSDDTLLQQHDGIQSAILHCKRSFNSRDSEIALSTEGSMSLRNSFEDDRGAKV